MRTQSLLFTTSPTKLKLQQQQSKHLQVECKKEMDEQGTQIQLENYYIMETKMERINKILIRFTGRQMPALNSVDKETKNNIISIIEQLIQETERKEQNLQRMSSYRRKTDQFLLERQEMLQRIAKDQKNIQYEKQMLVIKKQNMQRINKQNLQKVISEKEDYQKQLKRIQARQKAIEAEFRKKQSQIKYLQSAIKKVQQKNQLKAQLQFEVIKNIQDNNFSSSYSKNGWKSSVEINGQKQYDLLALDKFQEALKEITSENVGLKDYIIRLTQRMNKLFHLVNEKHQEKINRTIVIQERGSKIKIPKPQLINSPYNNSKAKLDELLQNIQKVYDYIQSLEEGSDNNKNGVEKVEQPKIRNLIQNFKQIIKSQDQILSKLMNQTQISSLIPKQNSTNIQKHSYNSNNPQKEAEHEQTCNEAVQNYKFQVIHKLIQQQMIKIEDRNRQLYASKKKLVEGIAVTERIKEQICRERDIVFNEYF